MGVEVQGFGDAYQRQALRASVVLSKSCWRATVNLQYAESTERFCDIF